MLGEFWLENWGKDKSMDTGYIKLYRKIEENPIVCKDNDYFRVWHYLLYNATHKEREVIFGTEKTILKPGQLVTGINKISKKCLVEESKVKRILKAFKNDQQIDQRSCSKGSLITILKWEQYQKNDQQIDQQIDQQMTNERPTNDQRMTTNNNEIMKEYICVYNNAHAREENYCHLGSLFKNEICVHCQKKNNCPHPVSIDFKLLHPDETFEEYDKRRNEVLDQFIDDVKSRGDPKNEDYIPLFNCDWLNQMNKNEE